MGQGEAFKLARYVRLLQTVPERCRDDFDRLNADHFSAWNDASFATVESMIRYATAPPAETGTSSEKDDQKKTRHRFMLLLVASEPGVWPLFFDDPEFGAVLQEVISSEEKRREFIAGISSNRVAQVETALCLFEKRAPRVP